VPYFQYANTDSFAIDYLLSSVAMIIYPTVA
jgi:hypothetical protein